MKGVDQSFHQTFLTGSGKIRRIGKSVGDIMSTLRR
jgi:hypothetical protein